MICPRVTAELGSDGEGGGGFERAGEDPAVFDGADLYGGDHDGDGACGGGSCGGGGACGFNETDVEEVAEACEERQDDERTGPLGDPGGHEGVPQTERGGFGPRVRSDAFCTSTYEQTVYPVKASVASGSWKARGGDAVERGGLSSNRRPPFEP
jgi:hypothetical protein